MLPHILIEAPTIGNEKSLKHLKEQLSAIVKVYCWFILKGGNFDAKQFQQPTKTYPNVKAKMSDSIFDGQ